MTTNEFSNEFDVLYNNITSNQAPGLDDYEKSVFLTKAQSEILREYFNDKVDSTNGGFDGSQKRQYDFSFLIKTENLIKLKDSSIINKMDERGEIFKFPSDYFLSINEIIISKTTDKPSVYYSVIPINYSEYQRLMNKPYAYPTKRKIWRMFIGTTTIEDETIPVVEVIGRIIGPWNKATYSLRYVRKPKPIILYNIVDEGLSIDGEDKVTPCELPSQLHKEILERAVTLAKISYIGGSTTTLASQNNKQ